MRTARLISSIHGIVLIMLILTLIIPWPHAVVHTASPPSAPVATAPGSGSEPGPVIDGVTPALIWSNVAGADYYALAISKYPYGSANIIYNPQQVTGTSVSVPSGILAAGQKYRWNMQAHNSSGWSAVSNTLYFQTMAPAPTPPSAPIATGPGSGSEPGPVIDGLTPTLTWNAASGTDYYSVAISVYPYGSANIIYSATNISGTSQAVPSGYLTEGNKYRWNMRAYNSAGPGSYSNTLYFQTAAPSPTPPSAPIATSPGSDAEPGPVIDGLTPTLTWNTASGADYYSVAISVYPYGSANIVYSATNISGTSQAVPSGYLTEGNKYRWNMRAYNSAGPGPYSNTLYFQTKGSGSTALACGSGRPLSNVELAALVKRHFPEGTVSQTGESIRVTAYAVARAESEGNPTACGDSNQSIGLWQIYMPAHPEYERASLFDPDYNSQAALAVSGNGQNWNLWCTWEKSACNGNGNESYKSHLNEARTALGLSPFTPTSTPVPVGDPSGFAIIVAGDADLRQEVAMDHSANNAYRALRNLGFDDNHIYYLNSDAQEIEGHDVVDGAPTLENFRDSISHVKERTGSQNGPLVIYLMGHGLREVFDFYNESDAMNSIGLAEMLKPLKNSPILVVFGSCYSGSFITHSSVSDTQTISAKNRIVITASHDDEERLSVLGLGGWYHSSDRFWQNLSKGMNVKDAFENGAWPGERSHLWLDDNGDFVGHAPGNLSGDGALAEMTTIGTPGSADLELTPWYIVWVHSPVELRVLDSQGRITGLVDGVVREEIPGSIYDEENEIVVIYSPSDTYSYDIVGINDGTYGLDIGRIENGKATAFVSSDIPTSAHTAHVYSVDWDALERSEIGVKVRIDSDGDGVFEQGGNLQAPIARFTYSPKSPSAGKETLFDASGSYDADGNIVSYEWNFGDGNTTAGTTTIHTFAISGDCMVTLTVKDNDGVLSTYAMTLHVTANGSKKFTDRVSDKGQEVWDWMSEHLPIWAWATIGAITLLMVIGVGRRVLG